MASTYQTDDASSNHEALALWKAADVRNTIRLLSRRWILDVLEALQPGPMRRRALRDALIPCSDKVLTSALRELESAGFISRTETLEIPRRVDYRLTETGASLSEPLRNLASWCRDQTAT
ncbi:MAG: hypothetical protein QOI95_12 [Acidimicrobiaceae bacterium]|jgi:DNA-binding HxlR family transcriptional regulator